MNIKLYCCLIILLIILTGCDTLNVFTKEEVAQLNSKPNLEDLTDCSDIQALKTGQFAELLKHDFELAKQYNICSQKQKNLKDWITKQNK